MLSAPDRIQSSMSSRTLSSGKRLGPFSAHSHTVKTRQSSNFRATRARVSTSWFREIFAFQNFTLDEGHLNSRQLWPCQKQPLARTTAL